MNTKKPIKEFGEIYEYLKDHKLREEKRKDARITIEDADFTGEDFNNCIWKRFIFKRCQFPTGGSIQLEESDSLWFYNCQFGPGRNDVALSFGPLKDGKFYNCKFINGYVGYREGEAEFIGCEFECTKPDLNYNTYAIGGSNMLLTRCKFRFYGISCGGDKLQMRNCEYEAIPGEASPVSPRGDYTTDFIFEDTSLANAEKFLWNNKLRNLTLKGCRVKGVFSAQQSWIEGSILLEGLKVGTYHINRCGPEKNLTIRDCHFSEVNPNTTYLFSCSGDYPLETLLERVECTKAAPCNLTGAGPSTTEEFRLKTTQNKSFTLRNCKIPTLWLNWLQTYHLVIENCEFGTLELKNARLGKVTIKNSKFNTLDLTRTLAGKFEIDSASAGHIVKAESNYPEGGYKIDGGQQDG